MAEQTDNLVLLLLRDIRKEQSEQRSLLLGTIDYMRRMDDDMRRMEQRLDTRLTAVRDDLELMLKSELLGRLTHFETSIDEKLERLSDRISTIEA